MRVPFYHRPTDAERAAGVKVVNRPFIPADEDKAKVTIDQVTALVAPPVDWHDSPRSSDTMTLTWRRLI